MATAMAAIESRSEALSTAFVTVEATVEIMVVGEIDRYGCRGRRYVVAVVVVVVNSITVAVVVVVTVVVDVMMGGTVETPLTLR